MHCAWNTLKQGYPKGTNTETLIWLNSSERDTVGLQHSRPTCTRAYTHTGLPHVQTIGEAYIPAHTSNFTCTQATDAQAFPLPKATALAGLHDEEDRTSLLSRANTGNFQVKQLSLSREGSDPVDTGQLTYPHAATDGQLNSHRLTPAQHLGALDLWLKAATPQRVHCRAVGLWGQLQGTPPWGQGGGRRRCWARKRGMPQRINVTAQTKSCWLIAKHRGAG